MFQSTRLIDNPILLEKQKKQESHFQHCKMINHKVASKHQTSFTTSWQINYSIYLNGPKNTNTITHG